MNSIRDDMKDEIRQVLSNHLDRGGLSNDDLIANLAETAFNVMDIDPDNRDRPKEQEFVYWDEDAYGLLVPGTLARRGVDLAKKLDVGELSEYLIGIDVEQEVIAIFDHNRLFRGLVPF